MPDEVVPVVAVPPNAAPPVAPAIEPDDDDDEPAPEAADRVRGKGGLMQEQTVADVKAKAADRARRKTLRELYGTDDETKIAAIRADIENNRKLATEQKEKLSAYEQQEAERKRASMTEVDQLKADLAARDAKIVQLEAQVAKATRDVMTERQSVMIERAAVSARIKAKFVRLLNGDLASHYQGLTAVEKKLWSGPAAQKQLERWVGKWAKDNADCVEPVAAAPKPAAETTEPKEPKPAPKAPTTIRRPIGAARPAAPPAKAAPIGVKGPGTNENGKTVAPGAKQMSHEELKAHLAKKGIKMPWGAPTPAFTAPSPKR